MASRTRWCRSAARTNAAAVSPPQAAAESRCAISGVSTPITRMWTPSTMMVSPSRTASTRPGCRPSRPPATAPAATARRTATRRTMRTPAPYGRSRPRGPRASSRGARALDQIEQLPRRASRRPHVAEVLDAGHRHADAERHHPAGQGDRATARELHRDAVAELAVDAPHHVVGQLVELRRVERVGTALQHPVLDLDDAGLDAECEQHVEPARLD